VQYRTSGELDELSIAVGPYRYGALSAGPQGGEFVLLLHGWPEFANWWTEALRALGDAGYRAIAVDQRGYSPGARPLEIADYAVENLVTDVLGFADSQGAERFHLVAHDWGGMVAWALATAHPKRLKSLTVLSTPHPVALQKAAAADPGQYHRLDYVRFFRRQGGVAERALLADNAARLRSAYGGRIPEQLVEDYVRRLSEPGALTATLNWYRAVDDAFTIPAGRISVPTLYVWGSADAALGRDAAERTADYIDAPYRFETLEGASHWLPKEDPDRILPLILTHLAHHTPDDPARP
jgi:pimeloyl-ACP methyl ester carboxylesterase